MCEVRQVKSNKMFPIIIEMLKEGKRVRITVTGRSMYPFLRGNIDSVELSHVNFMDICRGDIVLIKRDSGLYIMHRVLRVGKEAFFIVGDAQQWVEGPLRPEQLLAKVTSIWRHEKYINCSGMRWKLLSTLWLWLLPCRHVIMKTHGCIQRIYRRNV